MNGLLAELIVRRVVQAYLARPSIRRWLSCFGSDFPEHEYVEIGVQVHVYDSFGVNFVRW